MVIVTLTLISAAVFLRREIAQFAETDSLLRKPTFIHLMTTLHLVLWAQKLRRVLMLAGGMGNPTAVEMEMKWKELKRDSGYDVVAYLWWKKRHDSLKVWKAIGLE